jgi:hypothetical protein
LELLDEDLNYIEPQVPQNLKKTALSSVIAKTIEMLCRWFRKQFGTCQNKDEKPGPYSLCKQEFEHLW